MMRGELWFADLGIPFGSETGYRRPVIIMQNDLFNVSKIRTIEVVPLTTNLILGEAPGNVIINKKNSKLPKDSVAVVSQLTAIDKTRFIEKIGKINKNLIKEIESGIRLVLDIE
ncbi:type II toxin-antitoxin system PemK/MazF family toxin [Treponema sp. OMZ 788]|uniref:type II toxin-antitoxin system PemK/MazF family toxin n=1 Tax=unclassified Treponema TaxID=2638727 RepID=UPI0020A4879D|nr:MULTISPECIES: type II toxin-antitoxin system PemK/MazF family toxin [unclassified Treponema]UTC62177.1 type II toxin-antitoxin system PemK/MazF family toxin [Treponema sp. OMZ 787]UTC64837.1 type II toxin-antitoxin system PemK/MazF family toxin [Treponema sp. OMZ 788]